MKNNTIKFIDNILDNKSEEYNNNTYKIYSINTINSNNINNNNNIEEIGNNNETIDEENSNITEFMQKFINDHIITIDGIKYLKEEDNLRKIITTNEEKFNLIWKAHTIGQEAFDKTYERLRKSLYWKGMTVDIKRSIANCENCQLINRNEIPEPTEKFATQVEAPFTHLA